ncbi:MAG: head GIN domain-containing protein [Flavobacteriales bacterium]|jgi:hypothetical protein|nr:head GIN domain-containing protein [Flavobacteriales bacterium]
MSKHTIFKPVFNLIAILFLASCEFVTGQGPIVTKQMKVQSFDAIELDGSFNVELNQGTVQKVVAEGQENIIEKLVLEVQDDVLHLRLKPGNYRNFKLTVKITVPTIEGMNLSGSGDISIGTFVELEKLEVELDGSGDIRTEGAMEVLNNVEIDLDGSGDIKLKLKAVKVEADLDGSGIIILEGKTDKLEVSLDGSGDINTYDLKASKSEASIGGSGDIRVYASDKLDASISGSGDIRYKGNPEVESEVDGSGTVKASN